MRIKDERVLEQKRNEIMVHAKTILMQEGIDKLSIRKIATNLNQTPGIIYHYFDSKDTLLYAIVEEGYQKILTCIMSCASIQDPKERLASTLSTYMNAMCDEKELFLLIMNSQDVKIREKVDILKENAFQRDSIRFLQHELQQGVEADIYRCDDCFTKTQWIWCATYGVISRIVKEQVPNDVRKHLIQEHITSIMKVLER